MLVPHLVLRQAFGHWPPQLVSRERVEGVEPHLVLAAEQDAAGRVERVERVARARRRRRAGRARQAPPRARSPGSASRGSSPTSCSPPAVEVVELVEVVERVERVERHLVLACVQGLVFAAGRVERVERGLVLAAAVEVVELVERHLVLAALGSVERVEGVASKRWRARTRGPLDPLDPLDAAASTSEVVCIGGNPSDGFAVVTFQVMYGGRHSL